MKRIKLLVGIASAALAMMTTTQAQSFLTNGLVAYYPLDSNASDITGNGNNGSIIGSGITFSTNRFGVPSSACSFDGTGSYIQINQTSGMTNITKRTISAWINMTGQSTISCCAADVISKYDQLNGSFGLRVDGTLGWKPSFFLRDTNGTWLESSATTFASNQWFHIVATWDGTNAYLFQNGQIQSSVATTSIPAWGNSSLRIGRHGGDSGNSLQYYMFNGQIDDLRIYNRALSASEVSALYAYESAPIVAIQKAVYLTSSNLHAGTNYQVQVSSDLVNWTNSGAAFTATTNVWRTTNYWDVANWNSLFFRLQQQ
jgi:Concanavalin A-like lectin/glucanases superfamily